MQARRREEGDATALLFSRREPNAGGLGIKCRHSTKKRLTQDAARRIVHSGIHRSRHVDLCGPDHAGLINIRPHSSAFRVQNSALLSGPRCVVRIAFCFQDRALFSGPCFVFRSVFCFQDSASETREGAQHYGEQGKTNRFFNPGP